MVKVMIFLSRRPGMGDEEFWSYVRGRHAPLVRRMPGLRRLVVNYGLGAPDGGSLPFDVVAEDWFDSVEALRAALASPEGQAVQADAPNVFDMSRSQMMVVEEEEVGLGGGGA